VLEEVALDTTEQDGVLVAATSAWSPQRNCPLCRGKLRIRDSCLRNWMVKADVGTADETGRSCAGETGLTLLEDVVAAADLEEVGAGASDESALLVDHGDVLDALVDHDAQHRQAAVAGRTVMA
jgi:hypothetical protein